MGDLDPVLLVEGCARELALFAAAGFLIGGLDDLVIDLIWIGRSAWRSLAIYSRHARVDAVLCSRCTKVRIDAIAYDA